MIKYKKKICIDCGNETYIFSHGRCKSCSSENQTVCKPKNNPTGERLLFDKIWETRPHKSYLSGANLDDYSPLNRLGKLYTNCFSHMLPKGKYEHFRLNEANIILLTPQEHLDWHSKSKDDLIKKDKRWEKVFNLYETLKQEYAETYGH